MPSRPERRSVDLRWSGARQPDAWHQDEWGPTEFAEETQQACRDPHFAESPAPDPVSARRSAKTECSGQPQASTWHLDARWPTEPAEQTQQACRGRHFAESPDPTPVSARQSRRSAETQCSGQPQASTRHLNARWPTEPAEQTQQACRGRHFAESPDPTPVSARQSRRPVETLCSGGRQASTRHLNARWPTEPAEQARQVCWRPHFAASPAPDPVSARQLGRPGLRSAAARCSGAWFPRRPALTVRACSGRRRVGSSAPAPVSPGLRRAGACRAGARWSGTWWSGTWWWLMEWWPRVPAEGVQVCSGPRCVGSPGFVPYGVQCPPAGSASR